ncbi:MAG: cyclase family protein [Myxococcota bacterium]|nr:cyclase family protein [Myxococcota bacterium]
MSHPVCWLALVVSSFLATPALADCERFAELRGAAFVDGDCMETPLGERWWPHPLWGADDQAGSTNWYAKPEVIARALSMVKQNKVMKLGQEYAADMPLFGDRSFALRIPGLPTGTAGKAVWNDEFLATEVGQVGTQFDGLGHVGVQVGAPGDSDQTIFYNGFTANEMRGPTGLAVLGTEQLLPIVARGVLIDVAAARGVESMEAGEEITLADVRAALLRQGMADFELMPGDAVLFRTGWEKYWAVDNEKYNAGCPGIGMEVARWLAEGKIGVTGSDTWPNEVIPSTDEGCVFCVHTFLQPRHGIVNQENLTLAALAEAGVYQFAYLFTPAPIRGATGSMGSPIALY